jgi:trimeric autotransporter adhesin
MATLTNTKIKDTYKSLLKVSDNGNLEAGLQEITDGEGNASGVQLNTSGNLTASGTIAFGSLKDSGENITITKFVDEADGISSNDNDTTIPTSAAVKNYVDTKVTAEDLDFAGDSGTGAVDLDSQILTIEGTANEVVTSASGQTLTIGLPSTINVDVQGALTGNVTGNVSGNVTGNVTGNVSGDLTGNVTATSVLANGVVATTQASSDNSTKVATTAFVKSVVTAEDLDFGGDSGTGSVDLDSQTLTIAGTANEIVTSAAGQTLTVGLPSSITVDVVGNLTGNVSGNVTGDVTGNADTATALETSRTIALSGDVVASGSFDGSANLTLSATIQPNSVALGTDTTGDYVSNLGAGTGVTIANNTGEGSNPTITVNYGSTANTSVEGDTALTIQGTTNEIEVSGGAVTLGSGGTVTVGLPDNVIIAGDLTVNGTTTTINTQTLSVEDPLIELANQNASNSVDTGFFANYSLDAGVTTKYSGLFKDASDSDKFKLFKGLEVEPATTVDVLGAGYTKGDLVVNDLDAVTISGTLTGNVSGNLTGNVTGDLTGNVTATSVLANGVIATTQTIGDNSTKVATTAYVDAAITAEDLDIAGDSGTGAVDLDSQTLTIAGTANEIETSASGQTITIGLPSSVTVGTLTATTLAGTLSTAAQTNITSVGTLSSLAVSGNSNSRYRYVICRCCE